MYISHKAYDRMIKLHIVDIAYDIAYTKLVIRLTFNIL